MAKTQPKYQLVTQPAFAAQIRNLPAPLGAGVNLQRGYMLWENPMSQVYGASGGPLGDGRDMIRFLFNPSTVSTDYNVGNATLQAAMLYQIPGDAGNLRSPMLQQTVSWQLYFDRTYELNYGGASSAANDPAVIGCQADVYQFMQFTGVLASGNGSVQYSATGNGDPSATGTYTQTSQIGGAGIMMMVPCYVFFGNALQQMSSNPASANFAAIGQQLSFYGFISEWSVQYTHWTANMVPLRCVISVTFTMLPYTPLTGKSAVWKDLNKLGKAPYTVPTPYIQQPPVGIPGVTTNLGT